MTNWTFISQNFSFLDGVQLFLSSFVSVFVMVDPFAAIPVFLALTKTYTPQNKIQTLRQCSYITFGILLFFALTGLSLLNLFGISLAALKIAGGLLLLKFAFEQMHGSNEKIEQNEQAESLKRQSIAIVPLSLPLLAGPGAISTVVIKTATKTDVVSYSIFVLAIVSVVYVSYLMLRSSQYLFKFFGQTGLNIMEKLMGVIVAALAIQFILNGIRENFPSLTL